MKYDFDEVFERRKTGSVKWDLAEKIYKRRDILPMWVADMDFKSPNEVTEFIVKRAEHGIFGYSFPPDSYYDAIIQWFERRHCFRIERDWIVESPGVVPSINFCIQAFSRRKDGIVIQPPVYFPFFSSIENNDRRLIRNPLKFNDGTYSMDYEHLESVVKDSAKIFILCNPHNPVGRVWGRDELERAAEICLKHNVLMISDEIHCDLVFPPNRYSPLAMLDEKIGRHSVTLLSPGKTFNIAGLSISAAIIRDPNIRSRYRKMMKKCEVGANHIFGIVALEAAYRHGEEWLDQLLFYLMKNRDEAVSHIGRHIPSIRVTPPEGTYLLWLDGRMGFDSHAKLMDATIEKAGVGLSSGRLFGEEGDRFLRMNVGCPRSVLKEALRRLTVALS